MRDQLLQCPFFFESGRFSNMSYNPRVKGALCRAV